MEQTLGLHRLADDDLTRILRALYKEQIASPVQRRGLVLAKLGHLEEHLGALIGHSKTAAIAILSAVLQERRALRGAQASLLWSGPAGTGAGTRDPHEGVQELIATAQQSVLWIGANMHDDARLLRSLHAAQRGRGLEVTLLLDLPLARGRSAALAALKAAASELFWQASELPTLLVAAEDTLLPPWPRCLVLDDERMALLAGAPSSVEPDERHITFGLVVTQGSLARTLTLTWRALLERGLLVPLGAPG
jgi:hypothetical protein